MSDPLARRPRVGILGARRARQGLGPFVAGHLALAGASVPCFAGTSAASVAEAGRELATRLGSAPVGYTDVRAMLREHALDALAVLTPVEHHVQGLELALEHGLGALCEKPLVWGAPGALARGSALAAEFAARGLVLVENCQWPYTLPAFATLHPGARAQPVRRFAMHLSPASRGERMLVDTLPHLLSLLQALAGEPEAELADVRFSTRSPDAGALVLELAWKTRAGAIEVRFALEGSERFPRPAGYAIDGLVAERLVTLPDYAQRLSDGTREVELPDPLALLLRDFVAALARGRADPGERARIAFRMAALEQIASAFRR